MDKLITVFINNIKFKIPITEAVSLRDSLCSRLGCPSFCCDEVKQDAIDTKVVSLSSLEVVSTECDQSEVINE